MVVYFYECRNRALAKGVLTVGADNAETMQAVKVYKALGELTRLKIVRLLPVLRGRKVESNTPFIAVEFQIVM